MKRNIEERMINAMREVKTSTRFRYACKKDLAQLIHETKSEKLSYSTSYNMKLFVLNTKKFFTSFVTSGVVAALFVISTSSVLLVSAESTLPGDTLYPVKRLIEKASLVTAGTLEEEARIRLEHAKRRIDEAKQLANKQDKENRGAVEVSMKTAQKEIVSANALLSSVQQESSNGYLSLSQEVQTVVESTKKAIEEINTADKTQISGEEKPQILSAGIVKELDTLSYDVFKDVVNNFEKGNIEKTLIEESKIQERIDAKIYEINNVYEKEIKKEISIPTSFLYLESFSEKVEYTNLLQEKNLYDTLDKEIKDLNKKFDSLKNDKKYTDQILLIDEIELKIQKFKKGIQS